MSGQPGKTPSSMSIDDAAVIARIDNYQSLPYSQRAAARRELLEQFPALAEDLAACLDGLEMVAELGPDLAKDFEIGSLDGIGWDLPSRSLGDFRIGRELGRGGMGVVYEAEQISLGRRVALKVLPFAAFLDPRRLERFKQEAQAAAIVRHPNIVSVFCVGCERGVHFYAMELVEGYTLSQVIDQLVGRPTGNATYCEPQALAASAANSHDGGFCGIAASACGSKFSGSAHAETEPLALLTTQHFNSRSNYFQSIARLAAQIADAVHYAHEQGVVHRDLKPSNLMLDFRGKPWVTDFGLAQVHGQHGLTMTGDVLGTLRYMSPEQADGKKFCILDHRTDIYSLGVTLYELLTLRPCWTGESRQEILRQLEDSQPTPLRSLDARIPPDLETIVLKATARRPEDRYDSALELADDLRRFLQHKPIQARRASRLNQTWRWMLRHRLLTTLIGTILLLLSSLAIGGPLVALRYARLADAEKRSRQRAVGARSELQKLLSGVLSQTANTLEKEPGLGPLRLRLLEGAVANYEKLLAHDDDPQLWFEAAVAHQQLGQRHNTQGDVYVATKEFERAIELMEDLCARFPMNPRYKKELASDLYWGGNCRDWSEGMRYYTRAADVIQEAVHSAPNDRQYLIDLYHCRLFLGLALDEAGHRRQAKRLILNATESSKSLSDRHPEADDLRILCGHYQGHYAAVLLDEGKIQEAEHELRSAKKKTYGNLAQTEPGLVISFKIPDAVGDWRLGRTLNSLRRPHEAEACLKDAKTRLTEITGDFPTFHWARSVLSEIHLELGAVLMQLERVTEAEQEFRLCQQNCDYEPASQQRLVGHVAESLYRRGQLLYWAGRQDQARLCFEEILQLPIPSIPSRKLDLVKIRLASVCPLNQFRNPTQAVDEVKSIFQSERGLDWQLLGVAQFRASMWKDSVVALSESVKLRNGGDAFDYFVLSLAHFQLGDRISAWEWYRKAMDSFGGPLSYFTFTSPRELDELRMEAEEVLEISKQQPPP